MRASSWLEGCGGLLDGTLDHPTRHAACVCVLFCCCGKAISAYTSDFEDHLQYSDLCLTALQQSSRSAVEDTVGDSGEDSWLVGLDGLAGATSVPWLTPFISLGNACLWFRPI